MARALASFDTAYQSQAWITFMRALHSRATKKGYTNDLQHFMRFLSLDDPQRLLEGNTELLENQILGFVQFQAQNLLSTDVIRRRMNAIKTFYELNRKPLSWGYIFRTIPRTKRRKKDKAYTADQIAKLIGIAGLREKAVILLYCSSGFRKGGIPELTMRALEPVNKYGIFKITVYEGYGEEYKTFCTPEARRALEDYFAYRKRSGEPCMPDGSLLPDAPVIREIFNKEDPDSIKKPQPITESTLYHIIEELAFKTGLRKRIKLMEGQKPGTIRHDFKLVHGLRKFFDTQATISGVSPLWVEMIEGHAIKLKENYLRPTDNDLLEGNDKMHGYVAAIDRLTIDPSQRLEKEKLALIEELSRAAPKDVVSDLMVQVRAATDALAEEKRRNQERDQMIAAWMRGEIKPKPNQGQQQ